MIFQTKDAIDKIIRGEKTQTRRLIKPGEYTWICGERHVEGQRPTLLYSEVCHENHKRRFVRGKDYAVQPGVGKPTVRYRWSDVTGKGHEVLSIAYSPELANWGWKALRIRILDIWREDVRQISDEDARAEGYLHRLDFLKAWVQIHNKRVQIEPNPVYGDLCYVYQPKKPQTCVEVADLARWLDAVRPSEKDRYQAWVLRFEVSSNS